MINRSQKIALWVGISMALAMLIFPPYYTHGLAIHYAFYTQTPYVPFIDPTLGANLLLKQLLIVAFVTAAALFTLSSGRKEKQDAKSAEPKSVIVRA